jgi:Chlorophyll A-B binding protein
VNYADEWIVLVLNVFANPAKLDRVRNNELIWRRSLLLFEGDTIVSDKLRAAEKTIDPPTEPSFGWNVYAEQINGRFAMVGFVLLLALEWFTGQDFFTWLGVR